MRFSGASPFRAHLGGITMAALVTLTAIPAVGQNTGGDSTTIEVSGPNSTIIKEKGTVIYSPPPPPPPAAPVNVYTPVTVAPPDVNVNIATPEQRSHPLLTGALFTGIVAVVGGGLTLAAYVDAKAQHDDLQDAINTYDQLQYDDDTAWSRVEDARDDARRASDRVTLALGASAVALAATVVLIILDVSQPQRQTGPAPKGFEVRF
jgi:hypothetical protein